MYAAAQVEPVPVMSAQQVSQGRQAIREVVMGIQLDKIVERLKQKNK